MDANDPARNPAVEAMRTLIPLLDHHEQIRFMAILVPKVREHSKDKSGSLKNTLLYLLNQTHKKLETAKRVHVVLPCDVNVGELVLGYHA